MLRFDLYLYLHIITMLIWIYTQRMGFVFLNYFPTYVLTIRSDPIRCPVNQTQLFVDFQSFFDLCLFIFLFFFLFRKERTTKEVRIETNNIIYGREYALNFCNYHYKVRIWRSLCPDEWRGKEILQVIMKNKILIYRNKSPWIENMWLAFIFQKNRVAAHLQSCDDSGSFLLLSKCVNLLKIKCCYWKCRCFVSSGKCHCLLLSQSDHNFSSLE